MLGNTRPHISKMLLILGLLLAACQDTQQQKADHLAQLAQQQYDQGEYKAAASNWQELRQLQPQRQDINFNLGQTFFALGDFRSAQRALTLAHQHQPGQATITFWLAKTQLTLGNIATAAQLIATLPPTRQNQQRKLLQADILAAQKKYQAANLLYKEILQAQPDSKITLAHQALLFWARADEASCARVLATLARLSPHPPAILLQIGNIYLLKQDFRQAEKFFQQALSQRPNDLGLAISLIEFYRQADQLAKALQVSQHLWQQNPKQRFVKKIFCELLIDNHNFKAAAKLLTNLSEAEEKDDEFVLLRGKLALETNAFLNAAHEFRLALDQDHNRPLISYMLAISYLGEGQNKLAKAALIHALTISPHYNAAELLLAFTYYQGGEIELAQEHAARIVQTEPENFQALLLLGHIARRQNDPENAVAHYHRAALLNPTSIAPAFYQALTLKTASPTASLIQLRQILAKHPYLHDVTLLIIRQLYQQKQLDQAFALLKKEISLDSANPLNWFLLGELYTQTDQLPKARQALRQAITLQPTFKAAHLRLATSLARHPAQQEKILLQAIEQIPNFQEAHAMLAHHLLTKGQGTEAITLLRQALEIAPNNAMLANNLAATLLQYDPENLDEAMRLAQLAYDENPNNPAIADTLGWIFYKKRMFTRSGWLLEQAIGIAPTHPTIHFHLGMLLAHQHKKNSSRQHLKQSLMSNTLSKEQQQLAQQTLTELDGR